MGWLVLKLNPRTVQKLGLSLLRPTSSCVQQAAAGIHFFFLFSFFFQPGRLHTMNSLLPYRTSCCGPELKSDSLRWLPEGSRGELRLSRSLCRVLTPLWLPSASASGAPRPHEVSRGPEDEERKRYWGAGEAEALEEEKEEEGT